MWSAIFRILETAVENVDDGGEVLGLDIFLLPGTVLSNPSFRLHNTTPPAAEGSESGSLQ